MSEDKDTSLPTPKKAKTDVSSSAWDTLRQTLAAPLAPPSEVGGWEVLQLLLLQQKRMLKCTLVSPFVFW